MFKQKNTGPAVGAAGPANTKKMVNLGGFGAPNITVGEPQSQVGLRVTGIKIIDLRDCDAFELDREVQSAVDAPAGAHVLIIVSPRATAPLFGIQWVQEHGKHLGQITVVSSDTETITSWCTALGTVQTLPQPVSRDSEYERRWCSWRPENKIPAGGDAR